MFLDEMKHFQVDFTKHIYIVLVNAYTNCGKFDQAKQVIMDKSVPAEHIAEIKGVLVSAFSLKGNVSDAVKIYDAMKQAGCRIEPKIIMHIIGSLQSKGQIDRLKLLAELEDDNSCLWFEACGQVALYCVQNNLLSSAVDLLNQLKSKDELGACTFIDQMFCQSYFVHIWTEYSKAGLPFNVLTYLRMYQAFLASGDFKGAEKMLKNIQKDDKHVQDIVKACKIAYGKPMSLCKEGYI